MSQTQPHPVVGMTIPWHWVARVLAFLLAVVLGAGGHAAVESDDTGQLGRNVASLQGRVDDMRDEMTAARAADEADRDRLSNLEALTANMVDENRARDRLMVALLEVNVVGLRDISERLASLEPKPRPMPKELARGLNELQLDLHALRRRTP